MVSHRHFEPVLGMTSSSLLHTPPGPTWPEPLPQVVQEEMSAKPSGREPPAALMLSEHLIVTGVVKFIRTGALLHCPLTRSAQPLPSAL